MNDLAIAGRDVTRWLDRRPANNHSRTIDPEALLRRIENHLAETGKSPSRFGRTIAGDPRLIFDLRGGRRITARTETRLQAAIGES